MVSKLFLMLTIFVAFAQSREVSQQLRRNFYQLFTGFDMEQRIAYRIGQVGCLKSLLREESRYLGLGSLHRGNYSRDVSRFAFKQRIAFLLGQVNCLKLNQEIQQNVLNESKLVPSKSNLGNTSDVFPELIGIIKNHLQGISLK